MEIRKARQIIWCGFSALFAVVSLMAARESMEEAVAGSPELLLITAGYAFFAWFCIGISVTLVRWLCRRH